MNRSDVQDLKNPARLFLQWDGKNGGFTHFDKTKGEKGEKVRVELPLKFLVLDTLSTIKGYNAKEKVGFWSNEIRDISKDILVVRTKSGVSAKGTYTEVSSHKNCKGIKFCQSVYIATKIEDNSIIANIQMMGAALSSWINFGKKENLLKDGIEVSGMINGKTGDTEYKIPVFEKFIVSEEADQKAKEMAKELKEYLNAYFKVKQEENSKV